jgi:hypothetical protein
MTDGYLYLATATAQMDRLFEPDLAHGGSSVLIEERLLLGFVKAFSIPGRTADVPS